MASTVSTFGAICLLLMRVIFFDSVQSSFPALDEDNINQTLWRSGRLQRSIFEKMPRVLTLIVQYASGEKTDLKLIKRLQYLANEHLPVVVPMLFSNGNVMKDVDEFVMYQDTSKCAAVVYFKKFDALFGVIGLDYSIGNLPFLFDEYGYYPKIAAAPYIIEFKNTLVHIQPKIYPSLPDHTNVHEDFPGPSNDGPQSSQTRMLDSDVGPSSKRQRTDSNFYVENNEQVGNRDDMGGYNFGKRNQNLYLNEYYLETLVFVTCDVAEIFKEKFGEDHYIEEIVNYYVIYFNAIDMMFRKLHLNYKRIRMNIAKFEIEDEIKPFEFMTEGDLEFNEITAKVPQYLNTYTSAYTPDSFDYVFISTNRPILHQSAKVHGATKYGEDLYEARSRNKFYDAVPITVLGFHENFVIAVQEISRTMNIKIESWQKGLKSIGQCYSIMQDGGSKCHDCLEWSSDSCEQFEAFFKENRNRCFLENYPRSILVPGVTILTTPQRQCKCFGYDSYIRKSRGKVKTVVGVNGCTKNLECHRMVGTKTIQEFTIPPFDGTRCTDYKICWEGKCEPHLSNPWKIRSMIMDRLIS